MPQCCFAGCHNRTDDGKGLSFFRFPRRDLTRTELWIKACGRKDFNPSQHSRVCSQHFRPDDFERDIRSELLITGNKRLRLKDTAIPIEYSDINNLNNNYGRNQIGSNKYLNSTIQQNHEIPIRTELEMNRRNQYLNSVVCNTGNSASECMEPPVKRQMLEDDVLDLSRKCHPPENDAEKLNNKNDDDVILVSEDEDDRLIGVLCEELEKENIPKTAVLSKSRALLQKLESELRNEETALLLLQQLRANQRSHALQTKSTKPPASTQAPTRTTQSPIPQNRVANNQTPGRSSTNVTNSRATQPSQNASLQNATMNQAIPKVTKGMAVQALEQQCNGKKAMLRKQLERALDKVNLPKPALGNGLSEVTFVPSTLTNEFTALIGLEEIVNTMQDFDSSNSDKSLEHPRAISPFSCSRCHTDFTPVWKRKRPGSSEVVCEACVIDSQRSGIHTAYSGVVSAALKQHSASEREIEHEYQEIVNSPTKLDAFIKDHERKLLATQQAQLAQQQQQQQQLQQAATAGNLHNQRYHQQPGFQPQSPFANVPGSRHSQNNTVNNATVPQMGVPNVAPRRQPVSNNVNVNTPVALPIQQQSHSAANVVQQLTSPYQQLTKAAVAAAAAVGGNQVQANHSVANSASAANLMMAAAAHPMLAAAAVSATNPQQAVAQQAAAAAAMQQRLAAVAALSGFQHQHAQASASSGSSNPAMDPLTQFTQIQALLMNSMFCNAAAGGNQVAANNRQQQQQQQQQQLLYQAIQYAYLLQQQQAAVAAQAQQQQQQQQQQQRQQLNAAALQQLISGAAGNPAACMALLQNFLALNAATNGIKK